MTTSYGVVVLTMGKRRADLQRGLESLLEQQDVELDIVVVGNGWQPTGLPEGVRAHGLPTNLGIPAGRNAGVDLVSGDLLFFLDDDARLPGPTVLAELAALFAADPTLGLVQPRVVDPEGRPAPRRWTPRLRASDPGRSSPAMSVWEGAVAMRREAFAYADGWPAPFWYAHEGIELAWRVWDGGWHVRYDGEIEVFHPAITPTRHPEFYRFQARNRVWLARRNLPLVRAIAAAAAVAALAGCGAEVAGTAATAAGLAATQAKQAQQQQAQVVEQFKALQGAGPDRAASAGD